VVVQQVGAQFGSQPFEVAEGNSQVPAQRPAAGRAEKIVVVPNNDPVPMKPQLADGKGLLEEGFPSAEFRQGLVNGSAKKMVVG